MLVILGVLALAFGYAADFWHRQYDEAMGKLNYSISLNEALLTELDEVPVEGVLQVWEATRN